MGFLHRAETLYNNKTRRRKKNINDNDRHPLGSCSYRTCGRWLLCSALCLYFILPHVIRFDPTPSLRHPLVLNSFSSSRALIEHLRPGLADLKIYIYELPSKYNSDWLSNDRCGRHLFAAEVAIHRALMSSDFRTLDPYEADFFFVPVYVSCNFSTTNGFPAIGHAKSLIASAVQLISSNHHFWNRSRGADHVFVASHDYGACFHAMEEKAIEEGIPEFMKNSIILQTFGVNYDHPCQGTENVVIPPYIPPDHIVEVARPWTAKRDIWAFFRGKMEVHPKNINGRYYSKGVRSVIWNKFRGDRRFYLKRHRLDGYQLEIARSIFCLCPLGWAPWSPRLVESVALGCVPVIIADGIRLPFPEVVPWAEISLRVAEADVGKLGSILQRVSSTNLTAIQHRLRNPNIRRALLFNDQMQEGDATWQIMRSLTSKLDRSCRRSKIF